MTWFEKQISERQLVEDVEIEEKVPFVQPLTRLDRFSGQDVALIASSALTLKGALHSAHYEPSLPSVNISISDAPASYDRETDLS